MVSDEGSLALIGCGAGKAQAVVTDGTRFEIACVGYGIEAATEAFDFDPIGPDGDQTLRMAPLGELFSGKDQVLGAGGVGEEQYGERKNQDVFHADLQGLALNRRRRLGRRG